MTETKVCFFFLVFEEIEALKETVASEESIQQWMNPMHRSKRKLFVQLRDLASNVIIEMSLIFLVF